jgi:hypothetical protein
VRSRRSKLLDLRLLHHSHCLGFLGFVFWIDFRRAQLAFVGDLLSSRSYRLTVRLLVSLCLDLCLYFSCFSTFTRAVRWLSQPVEHHSYEIQSDCNFAD